LNNACRSTIFTLNPCSLKVFEEHSTPNPKLEAGASAYDGRPMPRGSLGVVVHRRGFWVSGFWVSSFCSCCFLGSVRSSLA
ncbi:hypothetical protein S83_056355, partial [Arachis hypogaea]